MRVSNEERDVRDAIFYVSILIVLVAVLSVLLNDSFRNAYHPAPEIPFVYSVSEVKTGYLYTITKGRDTLYVYHVPHSIKGRSGRITVS